MIGENAENKRVRNYKHETKLRQAKKRRLTIDVERQKAEMFLEHLNKRGLSLAKWINNQIDNEMNA